MNVACRVWLEVAVQPGMIRAGRHAEDGPSDDVGSEQGAWVPAPRAVSDVAG